MAFLAGFRFPVGTRETINMPGGHFNKEETQATSKHGAKCQACPVIEEHTHRKASEPSFMAQEMGTEL